MFKINSIGLSPNPVGTEEELLIQVKIITWDTLRDEYTVDDLKNSGETWESLRNKAVDMDYKCDSWDEMKDKYTWNSLKRYPASWGQVKGD